MIHSINDITKQRFISRLPSYTLNSVLFRVVFVSLIAVLSLKLIWLTLSAETITPRIVDYVVTVVAFNLLSEMNIIFDNILEKFLPIPQFIRYRLMVQLFVSLVLVVLVHQGTVKILNYNANGQLPVLYISIATGLVFVTLASSSLLIMRLMENWYHVQKQVEIMKQEKLRMDFNTLQDQLNPHFMFNNLSVLTSLIIYDKEKAVNFTQNFTDVYRYVIKSLDLQTVSLVQELGFIKSYIRLHQERLGKGLLVNINVSSEYHLMQVAPLTLQLIVENALKHNIITAAIPLHIDIYTQGTNLLIRNNVQKKQSSYSTHTGLKNLRDRYRMLSGQEVRVIETDKYFEVSIPLLRDNDKVLKEA
ncbi:sensor histidine kinase [Salinivirga cyanobacteriivorans]